MHRNIQLDGWEHAIGIMGMQYKAHDGGRADLSVHSTWQGKAIKGHAAMHGAFAIAHR